MKRTALLALAIALAVAGQAVVAADAATPPAVAAAARAAASKQRMKTVTGQAVVAANAATPPAVAAAARAAASSGRGDRLVRCRSHTLPERPRRAGARGVPVAPGASLARRCRHLWPHAKVQSTPNGPGSASCATCRSRHLNRCAASCGR